MFDNSHGQNICRLFHVLAQFLLTTNQSELDNYHLKLNAQDAIRVANRIKT